MTLSPEIALQILVNLGALAMVYMRLEVRVAVLQTELTNIKQKLGMVATP